MDFLQNIFNRKKGVAKRGFTLVELLVSIAIITILSISLYVQQSKFDGAIHLTNTAQEVALVITEARKEAMVEEEGVSHGVYFSLGETNDGGDGTFSVLEETIGSDGLPLYETKRVLGLGKRTRVTNIEAVVSSSRVEIGGAMVLFTRPDPEPRLNVYTIDGEPLSGDVSSVRITIESLVDNITRTVVVSATSQIGVEF